MIIEKEIDGDRIFLKKSKLGYKVVHPWKIDGKIVWKNFLAGGNWWNLLFVGILVFIIVMAILEYYSNIELTSACLRALPDYINLSPYINNPELKYLPVNFSGF